MLFRSIFVDWKMPGMDGIELTRYIRQHYEKAVVVMISATPWSVMQEQALQAGVNSYLAKPLFPSMIVDCINECLGVHPSMGREEQQSIDYHDYFKGRRILLAEDVQINREILLAMLEDTGIQIDCANNGVEAYEMFKEHMREYEMIFMDVQMPEMDGHEATRRIRQIDDEWAQKIVIVAMTANVFLEDVQKCLQAGMNDHVGKPLDVDGVIEKLRMYLPKR